MSACDRPPGPHTAGCADLSAKRSSSLLAGPHGSPPGERCLRARPQVRSAELERGPDGRWPGRWRSGVGHRPLRVRSPRPAAALPARPHVPGCPAPSPVSPRPCLTDLSDFVCFPELGYGVLCLDGVGIVFWLKPVFRVTKQMCLQRARSGSWGRSLGHL